jgi:hypothetical protein
MICCFTQTCDLEMQPYTISNTYCDLAKKIYKKKNFIKCFFSCWNKRPHQINEFFFFRKENLLRIWNIQMTFITNAAKNDISMSLCLWQMHTVDYVIIQITAIKASITYKVSISFRNQYIHFWWFSGHDFCVEGILAQVDKAAISLVNTDSGNFTHHLK